MTNSPLPHKRWRVTDAQGKLLALVEERHRDEHGDRRYVTSSAVTTHGPGNGYFVGRTRRATVTACVRHGWLEIDPEDCEAWVTDDGRIALGLWRQRKLSEPALPLPVLADDDRRVVTLADEALRLGYKLAPSSDDAKAQARRLRRDGWVKRGFIGASTSSVEPTPMATVEVNPGAADA